LTWRGIYSWLALNLLPYYGIVCELPSSYLKLKYCIIWLCSCDTTPVEKWCVSRVLKDVSLNAEGFLQLQAVHNVFIEVGILFIVWNGLFHIVDRDATTWRIQGELQCFEPKALGHAGSQ
jgi:hypothetical protein